jgi:hypothetical protein
VVKSHGRERRRKRPGKYRVRCQARRRTKVNPSMTCRNHLEDVKTAMLLNGGISIGGACLRPMRHPAYRGLELANEAEMWNVGTCRSDANGEAQVETPRGESTEAEHRGGSSRSSAEVPETGRSKGDGPRSQVQRTPSDGRTQ